jgi:hypothetical protein
MHSTALIELRAALKDVDELIAAHAALTGGKVGRPAGRQGAAITRAAVVLLVACLEAFITELFEEAVPQVWANRPPAQQQEVKDLTGSFANPSVAKTTVLFFALGIEWALDGVRWQAYSNRKFVEDHHKLMKARHAIAHGDKPRQSIRLRQLKAWRGMVSGYAQRLEMVVAKRIEEVTGKPPVW